MWRYVAAVLLVALLGAGGTVLWLRGTVNSQKVTISDITRDRDNLRSELDIAQRHLAESKRARSVAVQALARAREAQNELEYLKEWIQNEEDTPVPAWFNDLLIRLGFGMRIQAN